MLGEPPKNSKVQEILPAWEVLKDQISQKPKTFRIQITPKGIIPTSKSLNHQTLISKSSKQISKFDISVKVQIHKIYSQVYYSIQKTSLKKNSKDVGFVEETKTVIEDFQSQVENETMSKINGIPEDNVKDNFVQTGSSVGSIGDNTFSLCKILEQVTTKFKAGDQGNFNFLKTTTVFVYVIYILILAAQLSQVFFYIRGTQSFSEMTNAGFKVSDNLHLTKIIFNQAIKIDQFCGQSFNQANCDSVVLETKQVENILQNRIAKNIENLLQKKTFYNNKYFEYILQNLTLIQNGTKYNVDVLQFINFFIRCSKEINKIIAEKGRIQGQEREIVVDLKNNWQQLKNLIKNSINLYDTLMLEQLKMTFTVTIGIGVFQLFIICLNAFIQNRFFNQRDMFFHRTLHLFRRISLKTSEKFFLYFSELEKIVRTKNFDIITKIDAPKIDNNSSTSTNNYIEYKNYKQKTLLFINWTVSLSLILLMVVRMRQDNQFWRSIKNSNSNLLIAQNYSLQNYFQMKAFYLVGGNNIDKDIFEATMAKKLDRNQVDFNRNVLEANELFYQVHSQLGEQFSNILISDICKLIEQVSPLQVSKCKQQMSLKMMQSGLLSVMAYIERSTFQSLFDLKSPSTDPRQYFNRLDFYNIDKYLVFILKIFELTEQKQIQGILAVLNNKKQSFMIIMGFQIAFATILILAWVLKMKLRKRELSLSYGFILIFPVTIMKDSKFIMQSIGKILA